MVVRGFFKGAYTPEGKNISSRICFMINFSPHKLRVKCCNHCCNQMVVINTGVYYRRPFADTKNHTHHLIISFRGPLPHENRRRGWRTGMYMHTKKKKKTTVGGRHQETLREECNISHDCDGHRVYGAHNIMMLLMMMMGTPSSVATNGLRGRGRVGAMYYVGSFVRV